MLRRGCKRSCLEDVEEVADMRQIVANIKGNELMYTVSLLDLQRCQKMGGGGRYLSILYM